MNGVSDNNRKTATAAAFVGLFAYAITLSVGPASVNAIGKSFKADGKQLAALFLLNALGFLISISLGALFARKIGKQAVVVVGCALMSAGCAGFALAPGYFAALPAMLAVGFGGGFAEPMAMALVSDVYTGRKRTAMLNYAQVAFGVGAVGAPLVVGWVLSKGIDWRTGFFASAALCAAAGVISAMRINKSAHLCKRESGLKHPIREPLLFALAFGQFLYVGAELGTANWLAKYFADSLAAGAALAAVTISIFWGGVTVGRFITGLMAKHVSEVSIIRGALVSAFIWQIALLKCDSPVTAAVAVALLGISMGPVWPTILACAGEIFAHDLESAFSVIVAAGCIGAVAVPPIIGAMSDIVDWKAALAICPALGMVNIVLFTVIARKSSGR